METWYSSLLFDNDETVDKTTSKSIIHSFRTVGTVQIFRGSKINFGVISTDPQNLIFEMTLWSCLKVNRGELSLWRESGALVNFLEHLDIYTILKRTLVVVSGPSPPCATARMARSSWRVASPRMSASTPWNTSCWWRSLRSAATTPWMAWRYIADSQISCNGKIQTGYGLNGR